MSDGHTGQERCKAARAAVPDQKASASPHDHACDEALEGLGKSKEKDFCSSKIGTFLRWDLGTWTALGNPFGIWKSLSGNTSSISKLLSAVPPALGISPFCEPQAVPETHGRVEKPCEICQYQI